MDLDVHIEFMFPCYKDSFMCFLLNKCHDCGDSVFFFSLGLYESEIRSLKTVNMFDSR